MRGIQKSADGLALTLERLATGKRINSAKDDPSGIIAVSLLRSDISAAKGQLKANQQLSSKLSIADSGLSQIGSLLNQAKSLIVASANTGALTGDQISANQMELDMLIDSIRRITKMTSFQGDKVLAGLEGLLNGTMTAEQRKAELGIPMVGFDGKLIESTQMDQVISGELSDRIIKTVANVVDISDSQEPIFIEMKATEQAETTQLAEEQLEGEELAQQLLEEAQKAIDDAEKEAKAIEKAEKLEADKQRAEKMYWWGRQSIVHVDLPQDRAEEKSENALAREGIQSLFADHLQKSAHPKESVMSNSLLLGWGQNQGPNALGDPTQTIAVQKLSLFQVLDQQQPLVNVAQKTSDKDDKKTEESKRNEPKSIDDLKSGGIADLKTNTEDADKLIDDMIRSFSFARVVNGIQQRDVEIDNALLTDSIYHSQELEAMISDADFAEEASNLAKYQLLLASGFNVLQIAREYPKMILNLLMQS